MLLGFKQYFDTKKKQPTFFREKILCGVDRPPFSGYMFDGKEIKPFEIPNHKGTKTYNVYAGGKKLPDLVFHPKLHTIREDKHDRWKAGRSIQMVYRGPKYSILHEFNKGIPELSKCVSTQKIEILWKEEPGVFSHGRSIIRTPFVFVDGGISLSHEQTLILARNDGFNDTTDFFKWFNKDFTGKIIHFTDLKY